MKKWLIPLIIVAVLVFFVINTYNGLVVMAEDVDNAWAQVENQLKRRSDLIPNLVNTVQGFAAHEQEAINSVTSARAQLGGAATVPDQISAAQQLDSAISRLLVVVENYPDLKANQNFLALQDQLEGTENRIAVERQRYNEQVAGYNKKIKRFPTNVFAGMLGFSERNYYEPPAGDLELPEVKFE